MNNQQTENQIRKEEAELKLRAIVSDSNDYTNLLEAITEAVAYGCPKPRIATFIRLNLTEGIALGGKP